jgi:hypothetical protein
VVNGVGEILRAVTGALALRFAAAALGAVGLLLAAPAAGAQPPHDPGPPPHSKAKPPEHAGSPQAPRFEVGVATADADPESPLCLGGYGAFCTRPMAGIKDPLTTAAIAIRGRDGGTIVIVKATAVGLFASYKPEQGETGIYQVRQQIAAETGVPADQVVITADHSHAAPDTIGIWGGVPRDYMELLADSMVAAATDAVAALEPAHLAVAAVEGPQLDSSYSKGPTDDEAMDDEFRVLFADTPDGEPIAALINYAPHATVCGQCSDEASGDWTAWAAQEVERRGLGVGIGFVGALGAADWRKSGSQDEREAEARERINALLDAASQARRPVRGDRVGAEMTFIREPLAQPILAANLLPAGVLNYGEGDVRIDRDIRPPFLTGTVVGTYAGAIRIGDVFASTFPGEPFPQLQDALRDGGVAGPSAHFLLGAANDFLGYMVADDDQYRQTLEEGALFLAGCPEQQVTHQLPGEHDDACPDHWTLMVSPTIGRHAVCTIQDAAARLGFEAGERSDRCAALTALDGEGAPDEDPGADG